MKFESRNERVINTRQTYKVNWKSVNKIDELLPVCHCVVVECFQIHLLLQFLIARDSMTNVINRKKWKAKKKYRKCRTHVLLSEQRKKQTHIISKTNWIPNIWHSNCINSFSNQLNLRSRCGTFYLLTCVFNWNIITQIKSIYIFQHFFPVFFCYFSNLNGLNISFDTTQPNKYNQKLKNELINCQFRICDQRVDL